MTRPSVLVIDGNDVKLHLLAERRELDCVVHVDWVRFTCHLRHCEAPEVDRLFPLASSVNIWDEDYRQMQIARLLSTLPDGEFSASAQAWELAEAVSTCLGSDFKANPEVKKGHDFYRHRWSIDRAGSEVGWVGYLSSGDSPRQKAQSSTIHCNLYGAACTFAGIGWASRLADLMDARDAEMTRADLALDFFDGLAGGLDGIVAEYKAGACDVGGKRLKSNCVGDWLNGKERSLYFGSKEAGKQTNCYEKGHQLFGVDSGSEWLRVELRYGNKLRVLGSDILRRPADFFAGASEWHQSILARAASFPVAEKIKCAGRLPLETVEAECSRNVRWIANTAAASMAVAVQFLDESELWDLIGGGKLPGRLKKFKLSEIRDAFSKAFARVVPSGGCPSPVPAL